MAEKQANQVSAKRPRGNPRIREIGKAHRWKPGQTGNAGGVPKEKVHLTSYLRRQLCMTPKEFNSYRPVNVADKIVKKLIRNALQGCYRSMREILDRTDGKVSIKLGVDSDTIDLASGLAQLKALGWQPANPMFRSDVQLDPVEVKALDIKE